MSSTTGKAVMRSAAWRISLWATLAWACGTIVAFVFLQRFMAGDIQQRTDAWLAGEIEVLGDVAERTPKDALYDRVVSEVAELASNEVPNREPGVKASNGAVFFLQTNVDGSLALWVGTGGAGEYQRAIRGTAILSDRPTDLRVAGFPVPFRVASIQIDNGSRIYLGLSERDELRVLRKLTLRFVLLSLALILFGFLIVFLTTRRMLSRIRGITEAASRIGNSDLTTRVPTINRSDEIAQLAFTLNSMLDRIETTVNQLHSITDSLAHDLRSPLTAIRGKLEMSLSSIDDNQAEPIVSAIEELDRLTDFLTKSLDVAEARADALRLTREELDLCELLRIMANLYEPSMSEKGLTLKLHCDRQLTILGDAALIHRMIANLLDNSLKHLPNGCSVSISLGEQDHNALLVMEDDGPGFDPDVLSRLFETGAKGTKSTGHGLGLAFVNAVVRAHGGSIDVTHAHPTGARISVRIPVAEVSQSLISVPGARSSAT